MTPVSAYRRGAARGPDRGGALQRLWSALYGADYSKDGAGCTVAEAPARGAVGRSRGGACGTLIPRGVVFGMPSCAARTRPVRVGHRPEPVGRSRGGGQARLDSARGAGGEGLAP